MNIKLLKSLISSRIRCAKSEMDAAELRWFEMSEAEHPDFTGKLAELEELILNDISEVFDENLQEQV